MPVSNSYNNSRRKIRVGSDPDNDIILNELTIYPFHVTFTLEANGCLIQDHTKDEKRSPQTFLSHSENPSERIPVINPCWASYDDIVYLGTYPFPLVQLCKTLLPETKKTNSSQIVRVGTDPHNRIVIPSITVSPYHAEFILEANGCIIRDCDSQMGTFLVDSENPSRTIKISNDEKRAKYSDVVLLGTYPFPLARLLEIKDIFLPHKKSICIGRSSNNDRVLENIRISKHHAELLLKGDQIFIKDLGSTTGTFLNDYRIPPWTYHIIKYTDTIKIGPYELSLDKESRERVRVEFAGDIKLDVKNLQYTIEKKVMLHNISFSVYPGELIGILGPSGHGKSLLLDCISSHRIKSTSEHIFLNNLPLSQYRDNFRSRIGYVPQSEVLPAQLEVEKLLYYAARLWLPSDLSKVEIAKHIDKILNQLNLFHLKESPIRVLSGGELKRVSLAYELIRSPNLLLLDEPTTGLSVSDARIVFDILRQLADQGHTIITVIHKPSFDVFNSFDLVAILSHGRILYYGPPQYTKDFFKCKKNHPEEIFNTLSEYESLIKRNPSRTKELLEGWEKNFRESREYREYIADRIANLEKIT